MLAYLFWHRPIPGVDPSAYEAALRGFHESIREAPAEVILSSACYRLDRVPWLTAAEGNHADEPGFEDWYLVPDSAALDRLNEAAISARHRSFHDTAAALAGDGAGGLYAPVDISGGRDLRLAPARDSECVWTSKPPRVPYSEFMPDLAALVPADARVWQRRLVLGPAPEFCVELPGQSRGELPGVSQVAIRRSLII
jgi:hypothetical protein